MGDSQLNIDQLLPKLLHVEQRLLQKEETDATAFFAGRGFRGKGRQGKQQQQQRSKGPRTPLAEKECFYCHQKGHIKPNCPAYASICCS